MSKSAVLVAAALLCAPLVSASTVGADFAVSIADTGCPVPATDAGCTLRVGEVPDAEPLALAEPADFKDAAAPSILSPTRERDGRKPLVPALGALLAMIILLPRRPTSP